MNHREAHKILGTTEETSEADIKKAYRKLAQEWHPDKHNGTEAANAKFTNINLAWQFIEKNGPKPTKDDYSFGGGKDTYRRDYYSYFEDSPSSRRNRPPIDDISEDMIGANWGRGASSKKSSRYYVDVTLDEAFNGVTKTVDLPNPKSIAGTPHTVTIPAGVEPGYYVRTIDTGYEKAEVLVRINSADYRVDWGQNATGERGNLHSELRISAVAMMLGGFTAVKTIDGGSVQVRIPAGLAANTTLKLQGRGYWKNSLPNNDWRGDCFLKVVPEIKKVDELTAKEREQLLAALRPSE